MGCPRASTSNDRGVHRQLLLGRRAEPQRVIGTPKPPRAVTTRAVQLEVMNALSAQRHRAAGVIFWQTTNADPDLHVVRLDDSLLDRAAELFKNRPDKSWSLTDCVSFIVMQDQGITTALTGDHHFEQAGFQIAFK